jgi:hypothetical protein
MTTSYRRGWLAGVRFAADAARSYPDNAVGEVDDNMKTHLLAFSEGLALGASMRETEWAVNE